MTAAPYREAIPLHIHKDLDKIIFMTNDRCNGPINFVIVFYIIYILSNSSDNLRQMPIQIAIFKKLNRTQLFERVLNSDKLLVEEQGTFTSIQAYIATK